MCGVVGTLFAGSLVPYSQALDRQTHNKLPSSVQDLYKKSLSDYHVVNSYGLFRSMTGVGGRPEIVLEGSNHHEHGWKEYNFRYKPGSLSTPPPFLAPHQPRLDWQMWFAALGSYSYNPWIIHFTYQLLRNNTNVIGLLADNPFPSAPPKFIRALKYRYHFTKWGSNTTDWWTRGHQEEYLPPLALYQPTLKEFLDHHGYGKAAPKENPSLFGIYLDQIRGVVDGWDPAVIIWTFCGLAMLPLFQGVRFKVNLFGI